MTSKVPDFIFAGPNKSASTWTYNALAEHPDICMAKKDPVNFFDVEYYRGYTWYLSQFDQCDDEAVTGDESPGYIKSPHAPERIAENVPDTKIIFSLRNPIDRAFSQWWHGYTRWHTSSFRRAVSDHERFDYCVVPGFYDRHLRRWERFFSDEQMLYLFYDDFVADNDAFISEIYEFIGVDSSFSPSIVGGKVNTAMVEPPSIMKRTEQVAVNTANRIVPRTIIDAVLNPIYRYYSETVKRNIGSRDKYDQGMHPDVRRRLEQIYAEDVRNLEERTGRDLSN